MSEELLIDALRLVGASHLLLALAHAVLWRAFAWSAELRRLGPLTARVFGVHLGVVVFVLSGLGALAAVRPELLTTPSELGRLLSGAIFLFFSLRLLLQPLVFDPVLLRGSPWRPWIRLAALLLFSLYVAVYGCVLSRQLGHRG